MNKQLLNHILILKSEFPLWGYRRVWAYIRNQYQLPINKKRIYRLMKINNLLCPRNNSNKAKRTPIGRKPRAGKPISKIFERHCKLLGIEQKFTSYSNPKGNADTERMKLLLARTENNQRRLGICQ